MKRVLNNFGKYRFLLGELVKKDIKLKYRRSYLGLLWTLLEPILTTIVLTFVFSGWYGKGGKTFPVYILTGRLLYTFFANSTKAAMKSIRTNSAMIKKVYVPKYIYPISSILSNYIIFLISLIVLFLSMFVFDVTPTIYIFQSIIPLTLLLILSLGVGLILATMAVFFRDLEYLWSVLLMIVMYSSAIFYDMTQPKFASKEWALKFNPLFDIIKNFRDCILFGTPLNREALIISSICSIGSLIIGIVVFYKKQDKFILNI
ncbi:ABC transporter permease [Lachnospiraceae bacterium MD1]|uniref:Transport permease protein n=1 Tax=Variimorphobacter saccharofermentans TaxID=2755051 RepID=A0A839JWU7_9FIRM|nr:ABC transporter permease [Variimorphobacter saccharofermentans]MBB2181920.1 ABC transporter permease [Variimorphobacter saccharofermentans]